VIIKRTLAIIISILIIVIIINFSTSQAAKDDFLSDEDKEEVSLAEDKIPQIRMGNATIKVVDEENKPLSNVSIQYNHIKHSFLFGAFDWTYDQTTFALMKDAGINYATLHFSWNTVEPENDKFEWKTLEKRTGIYSLRDLDFKIKVHALVWMTNDWPGPPAYLEELSFEDYNDEVYDHIFQIVNRYNDEIDIWNVINEPLANWVNIYDFNVSQFLEIIKTGIQAINNADPDAQIIINFAFPFGEGHIINPYDFLQIINENEIEYDIIGLQLYYNTYIEDFGEFSKHSLKEMSDLIDKFTEFNKDIHITEISVPSESLKNYTGYMGKNWTESRQAEYLKAFYTIFFSKPEVNAVTWWDANDDEHFIWKGGLLTNQKTPKPSYYVLKNLLNNWTSEGVTYTNDSGLTIFNGFSGDYEIIIINTTSKESMKTVISLEEQKENTFTITFIPQSDKKSQDTSGFEITIILISLVFLMFLKSKKKKD
jgi:GH35 family endo-1,4-beta-xylanase